MRRLSRILLDGLRAEHMRSLLLPALLVAGCSATAPTPAPAEPAPVVSDAARQEAEQNEYYVVREGEMGGGGYLLSVNTPDLPQAFVDGLTATYGEPDRRTPIGNTWDSVTLDGISEPVTLTVGFNEVNGLATTFYSTFVRVQSSSGADLLQPGTASRTAVEAYLRGQVSPPGRSSN